MGLIQASATAKAFNLASNVSAAVSFIWHDSVYWPLAIIMGVCFVAGNWIGSAVAIKIGSRLVRDSCLYPLCFCLAHYCGNSLSPRQIEAQRAFLRPENMITGPLSAARPVVGALNGSAAKYCRFPLPRRAHKKWGRFSPPPFT